MLRINLGITYIRSLFINGKEYINMDYEPRIEINLGVPYIKTIKIKGKEFKNKDYKRDSI